MAQAPTINKVTLPEIDSGPEVNPAITAVQAFAARAGYDIATITGTTATPSSGVFYWGTATGVYTNTTPLRQSVPEYQPDNTLQHRLTFTLTNVQLPAAQAYFGQIHFMDGTLSTELTWTQPALNPSGSDKVFFFDRCDTAFAAVNDICTRAANQGWLLPQEWADLGRLIYNTAWFNRVTWNDGR